MVPHTSFVAWLYTASLCEMMAIFWTCLWQNICPYFCFRGLADFCYRRPLATHSELVAFFFFKQAENFPDMDAFAADVKGKQSKSRKCFRSFSNAFLSFGALCIFKFFESRCSSSYSKDVQRTLARFSLV